MKKFLSILVCMFVLVSSAGTMTADNGEQITVTKWSEETADVSKVGYQLFTAVSGEDTVTLRLNAGDYSLVLSNDMEGHNINGTAESNFAVNGGIYSMNDYMQVEIEGSDTLQIPKNLFAFSVVTSSTNAGDTPLI